MYQCLPYTILLGWKKIPNYNNLTKGNVSYICTADDPWPVALNVISQLIIHNNTASESQLGIFNYKVTEFLRNERIITNINWIIAILSKSIE